MDDIPKPTDEAPAHQEAAQGSEPDACRQPGLSRLRATIAGHFSRRAGPAVRVLAARRSALGWWSGLSGLSIGLGLMAGGLGPIGFSLLLASVAVLLAECDRTRRPEK